MRNLFVSGLLLSLAACGEPKDPFEDLKEDIDGLTNPLAAQGVVLGIQEPQEPELQPLLATAFEAGVNANIFLADAGNASEIEDAPITGASVTFDTPGGSATATEEQDGLYVIKPGDGLAYVDDQAWVVDIALEEGDPSVANIVVPPAAPVTVPAAHTTGADLDVDFTGLDFDSVIVLIMDLDGNVTYTNEPKEAGDLYEFLASTDPLGVVTIPGEAFPNDALYAVGLAGLQSTEADSIDNMNTALSNVAAGKMKLYPVTTTP